MSDTTPPATRSADQEEPPSIAQNVAGPPPVVSSRLAPVLTGQEEASTAVPTETLGQPPFASQLDMSRPAQHPGSGSYNMTPMANALPHVQYRPGQYPAPSQHQRYGHPASPPMMAQIPHMPHYGHSSGMNMGHQGYYVQQQPHMSQFYAGNQLPPSQPQSQMSLRQNMGYYPPQMMMNQPQANYYYPQPTQYPNTNQAMPPSAVPRQHYHGASTMANGPQQTTKPPNEADLLDHSSLPQDSVEKRHNAVRGPPRKPKQSGHAIWIGNLPPQTDLMSLVYHVCKEAGALESLFLISKSNCAFANFKDEKTCLEAQQKLHDSKFQAVKLVSRLRKNNAPENNAAAMSPTGAAPVASIPTTDGDDIAGVSPPDLASPSPVTEVQTPPASTPTVAQVKEVVAQQDKFFILKSLTVDDLDLSVTTGVWATQSHNEEALNAAFKTVDNVYLVFSANKSGEYFGYARMVSQIDEDPAAAIEFAPKAQATNDLDLPKVILTEANEFAPQGRIIDDSARGTIFWEILREESDNASENESEEESLRSIGGEEEESKTWGKPFKLEWLSTTRLPFYRTRGLRNPWNSNREVKIARDGTELEPSTGRKLISLFNKPQAQPAFIPFGRPPPGSGPGYPHQQPYIQQ